VVLSETCSAHTCTYERLELGFADHTQSSGRSCHELNVVRVSTMHAHGRMHANVALGYVFPALISSQGTNACFDRRIERRATISSDPSYKICVSSQQRTCWLVHDIRLSLAKCLTLQQNCACFERSVTLRPARSLDGAVKWAIVFV
jgi:hypothetical protein